MPKIVDVTQTETIRKRLEEQIASGLLSPGDRVDEERIANLFGTSRTPVREAVTQLVASGLLAKQPRRGAVVATLDMERILQLFAFAAELAAMCARFAARRMTEQTRSALEELHRQMTVMVSAGDSDAFAQANGRFHLRIIQASGNSYMIETTLNAAVRLASYFRYEVTLAGKLPGHLQEHRQILDACAVRDAERCAGLMRLHASLDTEVIADFLVLQKATRTQRRAKSTMREIDPVLGRVLRPEGIVSATEPEQPLFYDI
jgi:DNA-binding GntR family transcriptional regulator